MTLFWRQQALNMCCILFSYSAISQIVTRRPYLQVATEHSIIIRWDSDITGIGTVNYGQSPDQLSSEASETFATVEHVVQITDLQPNTQYFYSISVNGILQESSPDHFFKTQPTVGEAHPTKVWVLGDAGSGNERQVLSRVAYEEFMGDEKSDLIILLGDNAYDDGTQEEYQTNFFDVYQEQLINTTLWQGLGNHDLRLAEPPYYEMFSFPLSGESGGVASQSKEHFSFDHGNIHFITINTTGIDASPGSEVHNWVKADLAANQLEWVVVYFHHPPYPGGSGGREVREHLLQMLEEGGMDICLTGHDHRYRRSFFHKQFYNLDEQMADSMLIDTGFGQPAIDGAYFKEKGSTGTVYVTAGGAGLGRNSAGNPDPDYVNMLLHTGMGGTMLLEIDGDKMDATLITLDGKVSDHFTITKGNPGSNQAPAFDSSPLTEVQRGERYYYPVQIVDPENNHVNFQFFDLPSFLSFDQTKGILIGTHPASDTIPEYNVSIAITDSYNKEPVFQNFTINVIDPVEDPPYFVSRPDHVAIEQEAYQYDFEAYDPEEQPLNYELLESPTWLFMDSTNLAISGIPQHLDVGSHQVTISVSDDSATVIQQFTINVSRQNFAPVFTSSAALTTNEDATYSYSLTASDQNFTDTLSYSIIEAPQWLSITDQVIQGTPQNDDVGIHTVEIQVSDGEKEDQQSFTLEVLNTNDVPFFTSTDSVFHRVNLPFQHQITADDVDLGDSLSFAISTLPIGLLYDANLARLYSDTTSMELGDHIINITVSDQQAVISQSFKITVFPENVRPEITSQPQTTTLEDATYSYDLDAVDFDQDELTYLAISKPAWLEIDATTGILSGIPLNENIGGHAVQLAVFDGTDTVYQTFNLVVFNTNDPPTFTSLSNATANEDQAFTFWLTGQDVDPSDSIYFEVSQLPQWLNFTYPLLTGTPKNDDVGVHEIKAIVQDKAGEFTEQTLIIIVTNVNDIPSITSSPNLKAHPLLPYSYELGFNDIDKGDVLSVNFTKLPEWLTFDSSLNLLSGIPNKEDLGESQVQWSLSDGNSQPIVQSFTIQVVNEAPFFTSTPTNTALEDEVYTYEITYADNDPNPSLSFKLTLPSWLEIQGSKLVGTPRNEHVGSHKVSISLSDAIASDILQEFTIDVINTNDPPLFTSEPILEAVTETPYTYQASGSDIDAGDELNWSLRDAPSWLQVNPTSGLLTGIPQEQDAGTTQVTLELTDGNISQAVEQNFIISVSFLPAYLRYPESYLLYPNPTDGEFTVSIPSGQFGVTKVRVEDALGKVITAVEKNIEDTVNRYFLIDLSQEAAGTYYVRIEHNGDTNYKRLMINR